MNMTSFVATIGQFFKMNTQNPSDFDPARTNYVIPKYQREYKWDNERVQTLITDIRNRDKFLGNVILNKVKNYYEIVDGQQRITTLLLVLIALFNRNTNSGKGERSEEQKEILSYLEKKNKFILENESVGDYIVIEESHIDIEIDTNKDIYYQKGKFAELFKIVDIAINDPQDGVKDTELRNFQKKVLDCQVLVLIGEPDGREQDSIEEVFLDINFKSKLLDVADIFKGYCFKNYYSSSHDELKEQWSNVRKYTKEFETRFGYEKNRETCEYLYLYLLSMPDGYGIPANLSPKGKHFLEGKSHTKTKELLVDMIEYGKHIVEFDNKLMDISYFFDDICCDASEHKNEATTLVAMRTMALLTIETRDAQYHKIPFFMFIHYILKGQDVRDTPDFKMLKMLVTNFYIYAFLFSNSAKHKNKTMIRQDLLDILHNCQNTTKEKAKSILKKIREIRKEYIDEFTIFRSFNQNKAYSFYSIMDHYEPNSNFINRIYSADTDFTLEHLIIHDNSNMNVTWENGSQKFVFSLNELLKIQGEKTSRGKGYKNKTCNYLILPRQLNEKIETNDIISKISTIESYYSNRDEKLPKHISAFISHIESMPSFQELKQLKDAENDQSTVEKKYKAFIENYFSDENQASISASLERVFKSVFDHQS